MIPTAGADVYPLPGLVIVMLVMTPADTTRVPAAPVPPPPLNVTAPPFATPSAATGNDRITPPTPPEARTAVAVAVPLENTTVGG